MANRISLIAYRKKQVWLSVVCFWLLIGLSGCASIKEGAKGFLGVSTKALEDTRKDAIKQTFKYDYDTCYNKTIEILKEIKAYIYAKDAQKNLIAVYVSEEDTTPVGLFFKKIDANNTQIEVSSLSTYAREQIATKVFSQLIMALNPIKEEVKKEEQK